VIYWYNQKVIGKSFGLQKKKIALNHYHLVIIIMGNGRSGMADDYENEDKEVDKNRHSQPEKRGSNFLSAGGHRYMTNNNAVEVLGGETWNSLMQRLRLSQKTITGVQKQRRNGGGGERASGLIDFELFANIIRSRFERVVC
jgi:hypothetical protein